MYRMCEAEGGMREEHFQTVLQSMRGLPTDNQSLDEFMQLQNKRWSTLYTYDNHDDLQERVQNQVARNYLATKQ